MGSNNNEFKKPYDYQYITSRLEAYYAAKLTEKVFQK